MILKFREPVYNYSPDPEYPDGPQIRGPVRTYFWHIFGEVSEVEFIDETVTEDYINPSDDPPESGRPHIHVDSWIRDQAKTRFKLVHFTTPAGRKTVAFNTAAFLCNDRGDTVDKILA